MGHQLRQAFAIERHYPYLLSTAYVLVVSTVVAVLFPVPPPRFMDIYVVGIALVHRRWSAGPALFLYFLSICFCSWLLPPKGALSLSDGFDIYRMVSYSVTAFAIIAIIESLKDDAE